MRKISDKKKRIFFRRDFVQRKFSFHKIFSKSSWKKLNKRENGSIGSVRTFRRVGGCRRSIRSGQKNERRIFANKISP